MIGQNDTPLMYRSTRGGVSGKGFGDVLLDGLAPDGGLFVPHELPGPVPAIADRSFIEAAPDLMWPFVAGSIDRSAFAELVAEAYATFTHPEVVPVVELDSKRAMAELFHGPTLAFKDLAMQLLGKLFEHQLTETGRHVTIIGATSGDTGAAAIEAFRGRSNIDVVILHPHARVSEVQRRQMTTVTDDNVVNLAIDGTFDDCQDFVKAALADDELSATFDLTVVNSINWGRIVSAACPLGRSTLCHRRADRPRGADGQLRQRLRSPGRAAHGGAGRAAGGRHEPPRDPRPVHQRGLDDHRSVEPSLSPSMDIQVPSTWSTLVRALRW